MKKCFSLLLFLICINTAYTQCDGWAGVDTTFCGGFDFPDAIQIGSLDSSVDTASYSFEWSAIFDSTLSYNYGIDVSQALSDINVLNPTVTQFPVGESQFILQVTDSLNNICYDTLTLQLGIAQACLAECVHFIDLGDSITLSSFCLFPLIEPITVYPITVAPTQTSSYSIMMTDGLGCDYYEECIVMVNTTSIKELNLVDFEILNNPVSNQLEFSISSSNFQDISYALINSDGKIVVSHPAQSINIVDTSELPSGMYVLRLLQESRILHSKKIIKLN